MGAAAWAVPAVSPPPEAVCSVCFLEAFFCIGSAFRAGSAATAAEVPLPSAVKTTWPTLILSPCLTKISFTVPLIDEGTSTTALSVSSSITAWPSLTAAPGAIIKRTRSPCSIFSPSAGSLNSITDSIPCLSKCIRESELADGWVQLFRINSKVVNRLLHDFNRDFLFAHQCTQRGQHDMLGIHFEEIA